MMNFNAKICDETVEISLHEKVGILRKDVIIPVSDWDKVLPENQSFILVTINNLIDDFNGSSTSDKVILPHEAIVGLTENQAQTMGLPSSIPFAFDIRANGMINEADFSLSTSWVTMGGVREHGMARKGAFMIQGQRIFRIPTPVYEMVLAAEVLSSDNIGDQAMRYKALAKLHELLPKDEKGSKIQLDKFLGSIRVLHASSFSLQIPTDGKSFQFNPVLFSRKKSSEAQDGRILDESESLLTTNLQNKFASDRFKRGDDVKDCYSIDKGVYVYIDSDLKKALGVVKKMQSASIEDRKKFIHSPQLIIKEQLGDDFPADSIEHLFIETEQYAENVLGLGLWQPPIIPWLKKQPNSWLPEGFGIKIGDTLSWTPETGQVAKREFCP